MSLRRLSKIYLGFKRRSRRKKKKNTSRRNVFRALRVAKVSINECWHHPREATRYFGPLRSSLRGYCATTTATLRLSAVVVSCRALSASITSTTGQVASFKSRLRKTPEGSAFTVLSYATEHVVRLIILHTSLIPGSQIV